ncbi:FG-GAP repeat protein [Nostoc sp. FACHB-110]|uniref:FG-GAP repeat protein n=1 Tax=Nostoc sp. FACHB-110 TaxID=2692834 RepID=UPI001686626E|nr:FG-GAP repeat protein [Nostoc sp. FACHB-110]MBD2436402.1 FG-GAP repeat protein [Nostoc sp. FACHB-110]
MKNQIWHQNITGIEGVAEAYDQFGTSLTVGDFNGDGKDDLAIGVLFETVGTVKNAGAVNVIYGSNIGLTSSGNQIWHQDSPGIQGVAETSDYFSKSLAVGDFNGDGKDDLAIGVLYEDVGTIIDAGAVNVIYGSNTGLTSTKNQLWHQDSPGIAGVAEAYDSFGRSLAVGDFNGDGKDDLAIGVLYEDVGTIINAGAVNVIYGSNTGLTSTGNQIWHQDSPGIQGVAEKSDYFSNSLAVGDFNGDGKDDLAIGVLFETVGTIIGAGAVNVIYGSNTGLTSSGNQIWHQDSPGIQGVAEKSDYFSNSLAVGDFNGDGKDDLAIGVLYEDIGTIINAGAVNVIYGSNTGLTSTGNQIWHQDSPGIQGAAEAFDGFGTSLAVGDFNGDGKDDLAIGVPYETVGTISGAGAVNVIYGSNTGLTSIGNQIWHQDSPGIGDVAEASDYFGSSLTVGDFNNDGFADLAIGVPGEDVGSISNAGIVNILYGSAIGLTA